MVPSGPFRPRLHLLALDVHMLQATPIKGAGTEELITEEGASLMDIMLPVWLCVPLCPLETTHDSDMWRDYLNLSTVVGDITEEHGGRGDPGAS